MTERISDEELTAYLDDELSGQARDRVATALDRDPALAARAERIAAAGDAARSALSGVLQGPVPPALSEAVTQPTPPRPSLWQRLVEASHSATWRWGLPIAAGASGALVVALITAAPEPAYRLAGSASEGALPPSVQAHLIDALVDGTNGPIDLGNGPGELWIGLEMDQTDGCVALTYRQPGAALAGLACPAGNGAWRVATVPVSQAAP